MKKWMFLTYFIFISTFAFSDIISLNIKTLQGNKTVRVHSEYVNEERRYFIERNERNRETWQIFELRYQINGEWTDWHKGAEIPVSNLFSNRELEEKVSAVWEYSSESVMEGIGVVSVPARNSNNQMYWWVNRSYLHTMRRIYFVAN